MAITELSMTGPSQSTYGKQQTTRPLPTGRYKREIACKNTIRIYFETTEVEKKRRESIRRMSEEDKKKQQIQSITVIKIIEDLSKFKFI